MASGTEYRWGEKAYRAAQPGRLTHTQRLQRTVVWFVFPTYVMTVLSTLALLFLAGFSVVDLPSEIRNWMGPAVLGEAVSSASLIIAYLFRKSDAD